MLLTCELSQGTRFARLVWAGLDFLRFLGHRDCRINITPLSSEKGSLTGYAKKYTSERLRRQGDGKTFLPFLFPSFLAFEASFV